LDTIAGMSDEEPTEFEYIFALEYSKDFNGTRALQRTGHPGSDAVLGVQASRLLRNVRVQTYLRDILRTRVMTAEEVLSRTADIARMDLTPYLIKKRNKHFINIDLLKADGLGHLIKEISYDAKGNQVVKFDDRQGALRDVGKQLGLFTDKHLVELKLQNEVNALLDTLKETLPPELYTTVLSRLSGEGASKTKATESVE